MFNDNSPNNDFSTPDKVGSDSDQPITQLQSRETSDSGDPSVDESNPLKFLYNGLVKDGKYTKSFHDFTTKYSTAENIQKLYAGLTEDGDYTRSFDDFKTKYFSSILKKKDGSAVLSNGSEISQSELLNLAKQRKEAKSMLKVTGDMQTEMSRFGIMQSQDNTEAPLKRLNELNARISLGGYDQGVADDIEDLPTGKSIHYDLKGILPLKKTNPERYNNYLSSYKFQGAILKNTEETQGVEKANEVLKYLGEAQRNLDYNQSRQDTRNIVSLAQNDPKIVKDIAYARSIKYGANLPGQQEAIWKDPRYYQNEGGNLNDHQLSALHLIEDTDPETAAMFNRLLGVKNVGVNLDDAKIGYETKALELERIGRGIEWRAVQQQLADDPNNTVLKERQQQLWQEETTEYERYPAAGQMNAQRVMQEALGSRNGTFKKFVLGIGGRAQDAGNWIGDLLTAPFRSQESKNLSDLELLGAKEFENSAQNYQPENEKLLGSDFVARFEQELQKQIDEVQNNDGLDYEQKARMVSNLIQSNYHQVQSVSNDRNGKLNFTSKAFFSNVGSVASQLVSQLSLAYLMGGAGNVGKGRQLASLFGSTYATTYNDFYSQAIKDNIKNPSTYAFTNASIEAASELINNDFAMAKRLVGGKGALGAILDGTTQEVWDAARKTGFWKTVLDAGKLAVKDAGINAVKETEEEIAGQLAQNVSGRYAFDQDVDFTSGVTDAGVTTMAAMIPLGLLGLPFKYAEVNRNQKYALYEMGTRPEDFLKSIEQKVQDGNMTAKQAKEHQELIQNATAAVNSTVTTTIDGTPLSDNAKTEYAFNQAVIQTIDEQSKKVPPVLKDQLAIVRNQLEANQSRILDPKSFVESNTDNNLPTDISGEFVSPVRGDTDQVSEESSQQEPTLSIEHEEGLKYANAGLQPEASPEVRDKYAAKVKPISSAIRDYAKRIRDFEMNDSSGEKITGAFTDVSAIPRHIIAKGLEIIADAIDGGASLADAFKLAMDHGTRELPADKASVFRESLGKEIDQVFAPSESKVTKKAINQTVQTGKIKGGKVSLSPKQALHKQIRDFIRGEKVGFKSGSQEQKDMSSAMAQRIKDTLTDAKNKGFISSTQWESLFNRANAIGTSAKRFHKFDDYVANVLNDANYQAKLDAANKLRDKINTGIRSKAFEKSAYTQQSVKQFAEIIPSQVESIDDYNAIADHITGIAEGLKAKTFKGNAVTTNESFGIDRSSIDKFVDAHAAYAENKAKQKLADDYSDLVAKGIIDPDTMSLQEMNNLVTAINGSDEENARKAAELFEAQEQKMNALRNAVNYNRINLHQDPAFTVEGNDIVSKLQSLDISELSAQQLAALNDVINNIIINQDFTGSQQLAILSDVQKDLEAADKAIKASGIKNLGSIRNIFIQGFASTALAHDFIYKNTNLAAEVQRFAGISDVFNGHARARILQDETINTYTKLKSGMKDIDSPVNRVRRGILADVQNSFGGSQEETIAEFNRRKNWIKQSGERLAQSDLPNESREGEVIMSVYKELLENSSSPFDVEANSTKDNVKLVNFWRAEFEKRKDLIQKNTELFNNKIWEDVENYTATKLKTPGGEIGIDPEELKEIFTSTYLSNNVTQKVAGSKNRKIKSYNLPAGRVLNLDFDQVQSQVFYRTNYDVETSAAIEKVRAFMGNAKSTGIFGGPGNKIIVMTSLRDAVNAQRGQLPPLTSADKIVGAVTNMIRGKAVRIALGSASQFIKQYPSVAINTLANLGADAPLFGKALMVSNNIPLFKKYAIGLRGDTQGGLNREVTLNEIAGANYGNYWDNATTKIKGKSERIADFIMSALTKSDVSVARTSWLAYYMQNLKDQGIDINTIDWKTEHEHANERAAAYAEQQVSRTQNPNDTSSLAPFYRDSRGASGFFKNLVLPFSTFSVNSRVRMTNDVQKILNGGKSDEAYRSLAGTLAETIAFNAIKVYLIAALTTAGARDIASMFGMWGDGDDKDAENKADLNISIAGNDINMSSNTKKVIANSASDFFFSGLGSLTQTKMNEGINALYNIAAVESFKDGTINKYPSLFYSKSPTDPTPDYNSYGLYGILASKIAGMKNSARYSLTGTYPGVNINSQDETVTLTPEERKLYSISFVIDALGIAGISDADLLVLNQRLKSISDKKLAEKYGVQDKLRQSNLAPKY